MLDELGIAKELQTQTVRTMDKRSKLPRDVFEKTLSDGGLSDKQVKGVCDFLTTKSIVDVTSSFPSLIECSAVVEMQSAIDQLTEM